MPRPAKKDAFINVRCSPRLKARARAMARRDGQPLTTVLRALLVDYVRKRKPTVAVLNRLAENREQLRRLGVNLNQAARVLNAGEYPGGLRALVQEIGRQVQAMHDLLVPYHVPRKP